MYDAEQLEASVAEIAKLFSEFGDTLKNMWEKLKEQFSLADSLWIARPRPSTLRWKAHKRFRIVFRTYSLVGIPARSGYKNYRTFTSGFV